MFNTILRELTSISCTEDAKLTKGDFFTIQTLQDEISVRRLNDELDYMQFQILFMLASKLLLEVRGKLEKKGIFM